MPIPDAKTPTQVLQWHCAYTRTDHIECNCGWLTPPDHVRDPRISHAKHLNEKLAEKYAVIDLEKLTPEKLDDIMRDPIHQAGYGEDGYDSTVDTYSAATSVVDYLKAAIE